jgi:hypothetical protein
MPRKPKPKPTKPKTTAKPKTAANTIKGDVSNSAFVVGENNGIVVSGKERTATPDERIAGLFGRLLDNEITNLENNYNKKRG